MRKSIMYDPQPTKGQLNGLDVIQFTAVRACSMNRCPIHLLCPYDQSDRNKCKVETQYLDAIFSSLRKTVRNKITQEMMNKFTLHLLPLHQILIRMKIKAYSVEDVCCETTQGKIYIHPIFKEIRETIKAIEATQKSMGYDLEYTRALGLVGRKPSEDPTKYGDKEYWEDWQGEFEDDVLPDGEKAPEPERTECKISRAHEEVADLSSEEHNEGSV